MRVLYDYIFFNQISLAKLDSLSTAISAGFLDLHMQNLEILKFLEVY